MSFRKRFLLLASLLAFAGLTGCDRDPQAAVAITAPKTVDEHFAVRVGERTVSMQLAVSTEEMEKGLMYRQSLGVNEGMLFVYAAPTHMSFWMRNCVFPQNIGFFDASGALKETYDMYPHDEHPVASHARDLQFALEMNQGWFARNGLKSGAQLDLKAVAEALKARGFKPELFGLP